MLNDNLFIPYLIQIITGLVIATATFLLTLLSFKFQQKWKNKREKELLEKQKFDQLITILSEIKRALDRCKSLLMKHQEKTKSYSNLYLKAEETVFPRFFEVFDQYKIINKILAIYTLLEWVNWNINIGFHPEGADKEGQTLFKDRYSAAIGFIKTYLWGSAKNFNEILEYAMELQQNGIGKIPDYLTHYNLAELEKIPGIEMVNLN